MTWAREVLRLAEALVPVQGKAEAREPPRCELLHIQPAAPLEAFVAAPATGTAEWLQLEYALTEAIYEEF